MACCLSSCGLSPAAQNEGVTAGSSFDGAARALIAELRAQQTFARLGWQQNPDYKPAEACFDYWTAPGTSALDAAEKRDCDAHAEDLSRLYASYGTEAAPAVFKSTYYWAEHEKFGLEFPGLVAAWEANGGSEDDPSFLDHPVCAGPLQSGWTGSDYFYDGAEHPLCRLFKLDPAAATQ